MKNEMWVYESQARQGQRETIASSPPFCSSWQERDQVRITAISALGHMLHRVNQFKPGYAIQKHLYSFLVPLLLSFQDNNTEVVKVLVTSVLPTSA